MYNEKKANEEGNRHNSSVLAFIRSTNTMPAVCGPVILIAKVIYVEALTVGFRAGYMVERGLDRSCVELREVNLADVIRASGYRLPTVDCWSSSGHRSSGKPSSGMMIVVSRC